MWCVVIAINGLHSGFFCLFLFLIGGAKCFIEVSPKFIHNSLTNNEMLLITLDDISCSLMANILTHWGRVTQIWISNLTIIGSENGLAPGRHQAIAWPNAGILLFGPLGANFSDFFIDIHTFSFKKMPLKMLHGKWRPFCPGLNVLRVRHRTAMTIHPTNYQLCLRYVLFWMVRCWSIYRYHPHFIIFQATSLALGLWLYDCLSASEAALKNIAKGTTAIY